MKLYQLLIFLGLSFSAGASPKTDEFWKTTGLKPGYYKLITGGENCFQGELEINELDQHFSLLLNGRYLIPGLGRESFEVKDEMCSRKYKASHSKEEAKGSWNEICGKQKTDYAATIRKTPAGFHYTRTISVGGKAVRKEDCDLKLTK